MYTLYYTPGACSLAVHVLLNELNQTFELKNVASTDGGKTKHPDLLKVNPRGAVPVLSDDGLIIREGAAIMIYLLDKHQSPLLPGNGEARAKALEWLAYANATVHPAYGKVFYARKNLPKEVAEPFAQASFKTIQGYWDEMETLLGNQKYLAGNEVTAADILIAVIANWSTWLGTSFTFGPNVKRLLRDVSSRPSYQKALADEKVEYEAAA
jgi:glutathione S-transferase